MESMTSAASWESLLGLPLAEALHRARLAGVEPQIVETCAPRRAAVTEATLRVIRVTGEGQSLSITVSAFEDGDPRKC